MGRSKDEICSECIKKIIYIKEPICKKCGKPIQTEEAEYCYDCEKRTHFFDEGRGLWIHKNPVNQAIYAFKYQNKRIYGQVFGTELAKQYMKYLYRQGIELIIPIPLHKRRKKWRGYNQAEIIAKVLGEKSGIPVDTSVLMRVRNTKPQKQLGNRQRKKNMSGAFKVNKELKGSKLLLVDDIFTTGSTIDEAAKVLKKSGAEKVCFLTISIGQGE